MYPPDRATTGLADRQPDKDHPAAADRPPIHGSGAELASWMSAFNSKSAASPVTELHRLQEQVAEKDELIAALTARLEQAAEQLDRLRRNGTSFGGSDLGLALPSELVDEQKTLLADLRDSLARWEQAQAAATLGRLECQVAELRDLVAGQVASGQTVAAPLSPAQTLARLGVEAADANSASKPSLWEQQKAALLAQDDAASATVDKAAAPAGDERDQLPALPEPPAAIDWERVSEDEIREAVRIRDEHIADLRQLVELTRTLPPPAETAPRFDDLPADQREALLAWENRISERLRQTEIDLALERARLSREQNMVRQQREQLEKQMRRIGQDEAKAAAGDPPGSRQRKAWLGFLGTKPSEGT